MTDKLIAAVLASPINHLARPGTEGVIRPLCFNSNDDFLPLMISERKARADLNFRKIVPMVTVTTIDHEVLCYRRKEGTEGSLKVDKRSVIYGEGISWNCDVETNAFTDDPSWIGYISEAIVKCLQSQITLRNISVYSQQLVTALKTAKFRYLVLSDGVDEQVTLGIHLFIQINPIDFTSNEDLVTDQRWVQMKDLYEMHYNSDILLDTFSLAISDHYLSGNRY